MAWFILLLAGFAEVAWVLSMNLSNGFKKLWPSVSMIFFGATSFFLLSRALESLPIATAYAIWTGIGSAGTVSVGMLLFGESRSVKRMVYLSFIIIGVAGLKYV